MRHISGANDRGEETSMSKAKFSGEQKRMSWAVQSASTRSVAWLRMFGATMLLTACGDSNSPANGAANTSTTASVTLPSVPCESLLTLQLPNTAITAAQSIAAGSYQ